MDYQENPRRLINSDKTKYFCEKLHELWTQYQNDLNGQICHKVRRTKLKLNFNEIEDLRTTKVKKDHTENIDGWSADNVYRGCWAGLVAAGLVAAITGGKGHLGGKSTPGYNYNIHIFNAEHSNCLEFGTRINSNGPSTHTSQMGPSDSLLAHKRSFVTSSDITAHLKYHHRIQMFLDFSICSCKD